MAAKRIILDLQICKRLPKAFGLYLYFIFDFWIKFKTAKSFGIKFNRKPQI